MVVQKTKILFVSLGIYPCDIGGVEIFNYYLINNLKYKNDIKLFTYCEKCIEGIDSYVLKKIKPLKYISHLKILITIIKLRKDIDIICLSYTRSHWFGWTIYPIIKKILKIPYIVTIHGGRMNPWKPYVPLKWFFKNADLITGVSKRACKEYSKRTNRNILFTPPLIPFRRSTRTILEIKNRLNIQHEAKILLYVGSIKKIKGTQTLIKAFRSLRDDFVKNNNLILLIAGDGTDRAKNETLASNSKHNTRIRFLGNVSRENISGLYAICNIYIITSEFENTPLSLLEAMYNQLPIIASDVAGINNNIINNYSGVLFKFGDHVELAHSIIKLVNNNKLARMLSKNAYSYYVNHYDYKGLIKKYEKNLYGIIYGKE